MTSSLMEKENREEAKTANNLSRFEALSQSRDCERHCVRRSISLVNSSDRSNKQSIRESIYQELEYVFLGLVLWSTRLARAMAKGGEDSIFRA
ncbi:hypothetical protein ACS0TY_002198 [Phlomoides rotata]